MRPPGARYGFTLLEMSIVLAIIGVIMASGMTVFSAALQKSQLQETQTKLKAIQQALLNFRIANNRIPCPADVTIDPTGANFGIEASTAGDCYTTGTIKANFLGAASGGGGNTATFVKTDTTAQGSWVGVYGRDGYGVEGDTISYPAYASVGISGNSTYTWSGSTGDVRALQKPSNHGDRIAASWYSTSPFTINVNITDGNAHQVALYAVDWDTSSRAETITVKDASTNAVLDTRTVAASFNGGQYRVWTVTGNVNFVVTYTAGANGVIGGLFFDSGGGAGTAAVEGMVPTKALRLPDDYAFDGWGRRIMYALDKRFTAASAFTTIPATDTTARITINDASGHPKTTRAGYALISFGPNGHGAYPRNGGSTRLTAGSVNADELTNCGCLSNGTTNGGGLTGTFVQKTAAQDNTPNPLNNFDDVVAFGTRSDLRSPTE